MSSVPMDGLCTELVQCNLFNTDIKGFLKMEQHDVKLSDLFLLAIDSGDMLQKPIVQMSL